MWLWRTVIKINTVWTRHSTRSPSPMFFWWHCKRLGMCNRIRSSTFGMSPESLSFQSSDCLAHLMDTRIAFSKWVSTAEDECHPGIKIALIVQLCCASACLWRWNSLIKLPMCNYSTSHKHYFPNIIQCRAPVHLLNVTSSGAAVDNFCDSFCCCCGALQEEQSTELFP